METRHFDPSTIEMLTLASDDLDEADTFVRDLVDMFEMGTSQAIPEIENLLNRGLVPGAGDTAHRLKSSCLALGFKKLAQICSDIERAAKADQEVPVMMGHVQSLRTHVPIALCELKSYLDTSKTNRIKHVS